MCLNFRNVLFTFFSMAIICIFLSSCSPKEQEEKAPVVEQKDTLLDSEIIKNLENQLDFMEKMTIFKKLKLPVIDFVAKPEQYEIATDRPKMLIRFGMLCTDMAYLKVVAGKTQIPEYDKIFQKYVKELNISSFFKNYFEEYNDIFKSKELSDSLFEELKIKYKTDRVQLVQNAKLANEDFLIYTTIGGVIEFSSVLSIMYTADNYKETMSKLSKYISTNGKAMNAFFSKLSEKVNNNPKYKEYEPYVSKLKSIFDILGKAYKENKADNIVYQQVNKLVTDLRSEVLK